MHWSGGTWGVLVVVVVASLGHVGPVLGAPIAETGPAFQQATPTPTNETVQHVRPERADEPGDLVAVRQWLGGRMATRLEQCVIQVGLSQTDVCEFGDQYAGWLGQYVDVAAERGEPADERRAELYNRTRERHEAYGEAVATFERTYQEYRAAREAGDDERARALARELQRQADAVHDLGGDILQTYEEIEAEDRVDLAAGKASVNQTLANTSETTEAVESVEFVPTQLRVDLTPRQVSFVSPGTLTGELRTENGTAIANRSITLTVGEQTLLAETDGAGRFAVEYRPTTIEVSTDQLTVRYLPANASSYLGSTANVLVSIDQVEPAVSVSASPATVAFGDVVRVTGQVAADGVGAAGVPIEVTVDGRTVGQLLTNGEGAFSGETTVLAADGPGAVEVRARLPLDNRALTGASGVTSIQIDETPTQLTLDATAVGPQTVTVEGTLTTVDGLAVGDQPIRLQVNDTVVDTVRTDADGAFVATLDVPSAHVAASGATSVVVAATFGGPATNLAGSTARAELTLPAPETDRRGGELLGRGPGSGIFDGGLDELPGEPAWWLIGGGLLVLLLLLGSFRYWLGRRAARPASAAGRAEPVEPGSPEADPAPDHQSSLQAARSRLESDADEAVLLAYAAVRRALMGLTGTEREAAATHWEFLAACREDGLEDEALTGLEDLTAVYEQAAYAPSSVTRSEADAALRTAETLL